MQPFVNFVKFMNQLLENLTILQKMGGKAAQKYSKIEVAVLQNRGVFM